MMLLKRDESGFADAASDFDFVQLRGEKSDATRARFQFRFERALALGEGGRFVDARLSLAVDLDDGRLESPITLAHRVL